MDIPTPPPPSDREDPFRVTDDSDYLSSSVGSLNSEYYARLAAHPPSRPVMFWKCDHCLNKHSFATIRCFGCNTRFSARVCPTRVDRTSRTEWYYHMLSKFKNEEDEEEGTRWQRFFELYTREVLSREEQAELSMKYSFQYGELVEDSEMEDDREYNNQQPQLGSFSTAISGEQDEEAPEAFSADADDGEGTEVPLFDIDPMLLDEDSPEIANPEPLANPVPLEETVPDHVLPNSIVAAVGVVCAASLPVVVSRHIAQNRGRIDCQRIGMIAGSGCLI